MADVELLPLPEVVRYAACGDIAYPIYEDAEGQYVDYDDHVSAMHDYTRANLAPLQAENERLRAEVEAWSKSYDRAVDLGQQHRDRAERLAEALRAFPAEPNPYTYRIAHAKARAALAQGVQS